jgi:hypothetical protein
MLRSMTTGAQCLFWMTSRLEEVNLFVDRARIGNSCVQDFRSNAQHPRQWLFGETRISAGFIALDTTFSP